MLQTEREFTLPRGYLDDTGTLHREGVMRMATAADEILPLRESEVQRNPAYLTVIVLSRVVTRLGEVDMVTPKTIERLFAADVAFLQDLYNEMNDLDAEHEAVRCPRCDHAFDVERARLGGIVGYPLDVMHEEVAFIAFHFHWSFDEITALEHRDRRRWVREISRLNERINDESRQA